MDSIVAKLLNLAGLTGTGLGTGALVPDTTGKSSQTDFDAASKVVNPDIWAGYNSAMRRPTSFEEALKLWDEMANWDLLAAALSEIAEEATQHDGTSPATIWYECADKKVEEELNNMLAKIGSEDHVASQVWHVAAYGNNFERLEYARGEGVMGMSFAHPLDVRRFWLERNRRCVGYSWLGHKPPDKERIFQLPGGGTIQNASIKSGADTDQLWYPWDFMHMRRMYRNRISEHGEPMFEEAQGIYKKLRMAVDQMVVHRAQIQPDRYVVNIDVKDMPPAEQLKAVQRWKQSMRSRLSFGQGGTNPSSPADEFKSYYNAMALDSILWIAKPRDFQHGVEKLAGTASVPDVYDIELLINLFFSIIGMPKSWIGMGGSGDGDKPASGKALLAQDMRFLRKIKGIRRPVIQGYAWLGYFHCLLKDMDVSGLDIVAKMPPVGSLEDQMKIELLSLQADVLDKLADVMDKYSLPREAWIDVVFKQYLHLPSDVVNAFMTALPKEADSKDESQSKKPTGSRKQIMEDVMKKLGPEHEAVRSAVAEILDGKAPTKNIRYRNTDSILKPSILQESDVLVSGWGQINPFKGSEQLNAAIPAPIRESQSVTEKLTTHPGYRPAMDVHLHR